MPRGDSSTSLRSPRFFPFGFSERAEELTLLMEVNERWGRKDDDVRGPAQCFCRQSLVVQPR